MDSSNLPGHFHITTDQEIDSSCQQHQSHQPETTSLFVKESNLSSALSSPIDIPKESNTNDNSYPNNNNNVDLSQAAQDLVSKSKDQIQTTSYATLPVQPTTTISYGPTSNNSSGLNESVQQLNYEASSVKQESQQTQQQQISSHKAIVTTVRLYDELNLFDWTKTKEIINQIAEKAKNSVESVVKVLDPAMSEYLHSGGNINIMVITHSVNLISSIRNAFQTVFGMAIVRAATLNSEPDDTSTGNHIQLARGFNESVSVAQEKIKNLRTDTSKVPQNQVVIAVQPSLVKAVNSAIACSRVTKGLQLDDNILPEWFLTYAMIIEDPILGATMSCFSQFIPVDADIVTAAEEAEKSLGDSQDQLGLGFCLSIDDLMKVKLKMTTNDSDDYQRNNWLKIWSGLNEEQIIHDLSITLAHLYRRKWNDCVG